MYLHVGEDVRVQVNEIIVILDQRSLQDSPINDHYLQTSKPRIRNLAKEECKSMVVTQHHIYLSPLSSNTLIRRSNIHIQDDLLSFF
ncbi:extracellular matrix regulator RemB [Heyndrickxia acidiproducens]|uniref:extracellular matrix regulator RemB n=1 Tax=Heyndrickxia acidiproducens TaxID=1121084 RepID=UPI0009DAF05A|nr:extracellular matrix/biofilm biosynthesis regulator RemA family protein [Heyndrickxia acidiproducens]